MAGLAKIIDVHSHPILLYGPGAPVGPGQPHSLSGLSKARLYPALRRASSRAFTAKALDTVRQPKVFSDCGATRGDFP
jgi:hypothetical protein